MLNASKYSVCVIESVEEHCKTAEDNDSQIDRLDWGQQKPPPTNATYHLFV